MGAIKGNKVIEEFIKFIKLNNKNLTDSIKLSNDINRWCHKQVTNNKMRMLEAPKIGTKKADGKPLVIEDIVGTTIPKLDANIYGIYIPSEEIKRRHKHSWFTYLNEQDILSSNTAFTKYLLSSY